MSKRKKNAMPKPANPPPKKTALNKRRVKSASVGKGKNPKTRKDEAMSEKIQAGKRGKRVKKGIERPKPKRKAIR